MSIALLSNLSLLGRIEEKIMWQSGHLFSANFTVFIAHLIISSLDLVCCKSLVPVWIISDLGAVFGSFNRIDFAWLIVGHQMYLDLVSGQSNGNLRCRPLLSHSMRVSSFSVIFPLPELDDVGDG